MQQAERISFVDAVSVALRFDVELVERAAGVTPGMKPSQMPEEPRGLRRCVLGSQPLKLPITDTERAFGAHTLKTVPGFAVVRDEVGSHLVVKAVVAALVEEVEILVGEQLRGGERSFRAHGVR